MEIPLNDKYGEERNKTRDEDRKPTTLDEDIQTVREQDEARLPAGYHQGNEITTGNTGERVGVRHPTNPEDRFEE